jgi:hypothetical protein
LKKIQPKKTRRSHRPLYRTFTSAMAGCKYISADLHIDGHWPRIRHLNAPLPPHFLTLRPQQAFMLSGAFWRSELFVPHKSRICSWFPLGAPPVTHYKNIIVTRTYYTTGIPARDHNATSASLVRDTRPTLDEIHTLWPNVSNDSILLLSQCPQASAIKPYIDAGLSVRIANSVDMLLITRDCDRLLTVTSPIGWWCSFLSHSRDITLCSFPSDAPKCPWTHTQQTGKPRLRYSTAQCRHIELQPRTAPPAIPH